MSDTENTAASNAAKGVKIEEQFRDKNGLGRTLGNLTETIFEITAVAMPDDVGSVIINNVSGDLIYINPVGPAVDLTSFPLLSGQSLTIYGSKTVLDLYEFIRPAGDGIVGFMYKSRVL